MNRIPPITPVPIQTPNRSMPSLQNILVIEDDPDAAESLSDVLSVEGYNVTTTACVQEALNVLGSQAFGLILTDRRLPDGMIEDRLPEIKSGCPETPIIVVTGYSDLQAAIVAFRHGISDYVIKPIIPEDLIQTVRRIIEKQELEYQFQQEHAFAERLQSTAEAIILVLDPDGQIVHFNRFFTELTGWFQQDLIGENWFDRCIFEDDLSRLHHVHSSIIRSGGHRGITNRIRCKNGEAREIRWSNAKLDGDESESDYVLSVGIDVSDLAEVTKRAVRAERLAAIGETVAALAHESRNAIQRMQAAAEVLALDIRGNHDSEEELAVIQRAASDLSTLLESVRAFAAPIHANLECANLGEIMQRAWSDLQNKRQGRDATLTVPSDHCQHVMEVDISRMEQVFRNLFTNSLEACEDPVDIQIKCQCTDDDIRLSVIDNGPGLNQDQATHLFEPFYTTKSTGTGLGMPICQRIIEAHGGDIHAESHPGQTTINICLPRTLPASHDPSFGPNDA
ncbi:ATP-binding protein [Rhodopirellula halodulae]|uniref:ATP-binding protein n=1 Tax=Rhodopirellula halodulae TaxID=2894198 RepID=UPI001E4831DC|nr:ATP-binding protein [Rhodopirellula sp. JC737]MCC9656255.1 response regulator [Rhodopirellula sp. JC737]